MIQEDAVQSSCVSGSTGQEHHGLQAAAAQEEEVKTRPPAAAAKVPADKPESQPGHGGLSDDLMARFLALKSN